MIRLQLLAATLLAGIVAPGSATISLRTESYSFDDFLREFGKKYDSEEEYLRRKHIFHRNWMTIQNHNQQNDHNYTLGINHFADLFEEELPMGLDKSLHPAYGAPASSTSAEKRSLRSELSRLTTRSAPFDMDFDVSDLPKSVDWRMQPSVTTAVKNQGGCGSCWAFAATAALESHIAIQTGKLFDLSVQELVSCAPNPNACGGHGGCTGSTAELAYEFISQHGMLEEWRFAYQSFNGAKVNCTVLKDDVNKNTVVEGAGT